MARKDVELVIRASDQTSSTVSAITKALNGLIKTEGTLSKSTDGAGGALLGLAKSLGDLNRALRGMTAAEKLSREMENATRAIESQNKALASNVAEQQRNQKELAETTARAAALQAEMQELSSSMTKQQAALKGQRDGHAKLNAELSEATAIRDRAANAETKLTAQIEQQQAKIGEAQTKYDGYAAAVTAAEKPTQQLVNRLEAAAIALDKKRSKLTELENKLSETKTSFASTGAEVERLAGELERSSAAIDQQKNDLNTSKSSLSNFKSELRETVAAEKALSQEARNLGSSQDRLRSDLASSAESMDKLQAAAKEAETSLGQLAAKARGPLLQAFRQQGETVGKLQALWKQNEAAARSMSEEIGRVGVPTRQMSAAFDAARAAARQSKDEMLQQTYVLQQMRTSLRETAGDTDQLANRQRTFSAALERSDAALKQVQAATRQAGDGMARLQQASAGAASNQRQVASGVRETADAANRAAGATDKLSQAYRRLYGESRQAMSWTQRLRGEVLSLIATYGGLYGAIDILRQTVQAYQKLEAAGSRLNAVFDGNQAQVGQELDFIRRNADRLGVEFGQLADEYTKFAAATKNTNLQGEETRRIFISVAEAARVNKLSTEDLEGVFRALTQIASKGKVQLEELTGQLGDRLPGALQIMADGLGVTTQELLDMTKNGEVTSDALSGFADEQDRRFGSQLPAALKSTTTLIVQLQNAFTQFLIEFGKAGFIDGFNTLLKSLIATLKDADFLEFARNLSAALGVMAQALALAAENWKLLVIAAGSFAAIRLLPVLQASSTALLTYGRNLQMTAKFSRVVAVEAASMAGPLAGASRAFIGLRAAIGGLLASTGVGLAITAVVAGISLWATSADKASEAMDGHRKLVDEVKNSYDRVGGSVEKWTQQVRETTKLQAAANLEKVREASKALREELRELPGYVSRAGDRDTAKALSELQKQFIATGGDVDEYKRKIQELAEASDDESVKEWAVRLLNAADSMRDIQKELTEAEQLFKATNGTIAEQEEALKGLNGVVDENSKAFSGAKDSVGDYEKALLKLKEGLPEFAEELKRLKAEMDIQEAIKGLSFNQITPEILSLINRQRDQAAFGDASKSLAGFTDGLSAATALIKKREGFITGAKWDVNAYRVGYGSDTITDSNNRVSRVTASTTVTMEGALRDLTRRTAEFMNIARKQAGADRFSQFNPQQQGVLTSIAYNYGELPSRILDAVRTGSSEEIAQAIKGLRNDNGGINKGRRDEEAFIFSNGEFETANSDRLLKNEQDRVTARKEFNAELDQSLAATQQDLSLKDQDIVKREQAKVIREAEAELAEKGLTLDDAQRQKIMERVELQYREQANLDAKNSKLDKAKAAEEELNRLLEQRAALEERAKLYESMGETDKAASARSEMEGLNSAIEQATQNAIAMWQAVGGSEATTAIQSLRTAQVEAQKLAQAGQKSLIDWQQVGDLFANGLVNAFDEFAQAVANGEDVGEAAKRAFMKFAAQFLIDIGKMILRQIVFNAVSGLMKSFGLGPLAGATGGVGLFHGGGKIGSVPNRTRNVDMAMFANAPRFHEGNSGGLRSNEYPAILERNERVLTEKQDQLVQSQLAQGGKQQPVNLRVINTFNSEEVIQEGLNTPAGEEAVLNIVRKNKGNIGEVLRG